MPTRVVTSKPAASATRRSRPEHPSRSAIASAAGTTSGVTSVRVAHGDGGHQVAVEQGCARKREPVAADHAALARLRESGGERRDLLGLFALMARDRAGDGVEQ